jgi:hypothetical protein
MFDSSDGTLDIIEQLTRVLRCGPPREDFIWA